VLGPARPGVQSDEHAVQKVRLPAGVLVDAREEAGVAHTASSPFPPSAKLSASVSYSPASSPRRRSVSLMVIGSLVQSSGLVQASAVSEYRSSRHRVRGNGPSTRRT